MSAFPLEYGYQKYVENAVLQLLNDEVTICVTDDDA
jgi:hypothetical protein